MTDGPFMINSKNINCINCHKEIAINSEGFLHDEDLNIICPYCLKIIFSTSEQYDAQVKSINITCHNAYQVYSKKEPLAIRE